MSQSRSIETETGMEDKEGEKKEDDPHAKQEQQAFTSGGASSSSSSTPTDTKYYKFRTVFIKNQEEMSHSRSIDNEKGLEDREGERKEDDPDTKQEQEACTSGDVSSSSDPMPKETPYFKRLAIFLKHRGNMSQSRSTDNKTGLEDKKEEKRENDPDTKQEQEAFTRGDASYSSNPTPIETKNFKQLAVLLKHQGKMSQSRSIDNEKGLEDREWEIKEDHPDTKQEQEAFTSGDVSSSSNPTPTETQHFKRLARFSKHQGKMDQSRSIDNKTGLEDKEEERKEDDPDTKQEQEAFTSGDASSSSNPKPIETKNFKRLAVLLKHQGKMYRSRSIDNETGLEDKKGEKKEDEPDNKPEKNAFTSGDLSSSSNAMPTETKYFKRFKIRLKNQGKMSQSRSIDNEMGLEDKVGEKKEDKPDTKQEKEAFPSKDVSSSSCPTPTENVGTDAEMSDKVPSEQLNLGLPIKKRKIPLMAQAQEVASEPKSEDARGPEMAQQPQDVACELNTEDATRLEMAQAEDVTYESYTDWNSADYVVYDYIGFFYSGILLFEVQLTKEDIKTDRLLIPAEDAADHFPPLQNRHKNFTARIEVTDTNDENWIMTLSYYSIEHAFFVTKGWLRFVKQHKLVAKDWVRVLRPEPRKHHAHFLIEFVKGGREQVPEFNEERYLFKVDLTETDVTYGRLIVPREEVRRHFPAINLPDGNHRVERMRWTDEMGRDWTVKILYADNMVGYMLLDGWEKFVKQHELKAMDVVRFYRPQTTRNPRHALVKCEKRARVSKTGNG